MKNEGFGLILVLHDLNLAYQYADKIGLLKNGKLKYIGDTDKICTNANLSYIFDSKIEVHKSNRVIKY